MRRADLSPERQARLLPAPGHPGAFAIDPGPPPARVDSGGAGRNVVQADAALARLQAVVDPLPNSSLVTRTLDRREAVRSSWIEGTRAGVEEVLTYEATQDKGAATPDVRSTVNYVRALDWGARAAETVGRAALTPQLVESLHAELMAGIDEYPDVPGETRAVQNWIGGGRIYDARMVPCPPQRVDERLAELMASLAKSSDSEAPFELSVVVRMAVAHAWFELIHPFRDGNGRVGRLLMSLMLVADGLPSLYLSGYLAANRDAYFDTLAGAQLRGEWPAWVAFLAQAVERAARESEEHARSLLTIRADWVSRLSNLRSHAAAQRGPDVLLEQPVVTGPWLCRRLGVSKPTASKALADWQARGIVERLPGRSRPARYRAAEVLEVLRRGSGDRFGG